MPKQLINTIGLLIVLGIIAAATLVVALPLYIQSLGTDAQTGAVASQNATTQAKVDALAAQDMSRVEADATALRAQIPAEARIDTVSSLIARAAAAHKVTIVSMTPSVQEAFVAPGTEAANATATDAPTTEVGSEGTAPALTGKQQIPLEFEVTGPDLKSVLAFLDDVREGPRLLGNIEVNYSSRSGDANARIKALAYAAGTGS